RAQEAPVAVARRRSGPAARHGRPECRRDGVQPAIDGRAGRIPREIPRDTTTSCDCRRRAPPARPRAPDGARGPALRAQSPAPAPAELPPRPGRQPPAPPGCDAPWSHREADPDATPAPAPRPTAVDGPLTR